MVINSVIPILLPVSIRRLYPEFGMSQLRSLKSGKAVGLDRIPARLLKDSADIVAKPVAFIINTSLRNAQVPSDWNLHGSFHSLKRERLMRWTIIARFPFYLFYLRF